MRTPIYKRIIFLGIVIFFLGYLKLIASDTTKVYYRHLIYNHVSPYFTYKGSYKINEDQASKMNHYCFCYVDNYLVKIISKGDDWKTHPLAFIGAPVAEISHESNKEIWKFYDSQGNPTINYREVYVEEYEIEDGKRKSLKFYNSTGEAMESNWGIWEYLWEEKDSLIIENRSNIIGDAMYLSSYFPFGITGFIIGENGMSKACYNLGEDGKEITNSNQNVASYHDVYDANLNHIEYSYYNQDGVEATNAWGYSLCIKTYNDLGYMTKETYYNKGTYVSTNSHSYSSFGDIFYESPSFISSKYYKDMNTTIYPNPCVDKNLNLCITDRYCGEVSIDIYTLNGQLKSSATVIKQKYQANFSIPVNNLSTGIYLIKVQFDKAINVEKMVVLN